MEAGLNDSKPTISLDNIQRKLQYFSKYNNIGLYTGKNFYKLHEDVRDYLSQPFSSQEVRQKAHGNFLWSIKPYLSTSFQKEAVAFIDANVKQLDLSDKDKINFLNYMLSMKNYNRFSERTFKAFSSFDLEDENQENANYKILQSCNIFNKIKKLLDSKYKKTEDYQSLTKRIYPFLEMYSRKCPQVSHEIIEEYSEILFSMSTKFPFTRIPVMPLKNLMERTINLKHSQVKMNNMFGEVEPSSNKPQIDKKAVIKVFDMYAQYSLNLEKENINDDNLYNSMTTMGCYIAKNYDYSLADVRSLRDVLGKQFSPTQQNHQLYEMGRLVQKDYNDAQPRKFNMRNKTIDPLLVLQQREM